MTTAGTSQFNLLDINEIHRLNKCVAENFNKNNILGIPPLSNIHVQSFVEFPPRQESASLNVNEAIEKAKSLNYGH